MKRSVQYGFFVLSFDNSQLIKGIEDAQATCQVCLPRRDLHHGKNVGSGR